MVFNEKGLECRSRSILDVCSLNFSGGRSQSWFSNVCDESKAEAFCYLSVLCLFILAYSLKTVSQKPLYSHPSVKFDSFSKTRVIFLGEFYEVCGTY